MSADFHDRAQHIHRLALLDAESGLPNRLGVERRLIDEIGGGAGAVVVSGLDVAGGARLREAAERFDGEQAIVGRLGADSLALAFAIGEAGGAGAALSAMLARTGMAPCAGFVVAPARGLDAYALLDGAERALARARAGAAAPFFLSADALSNEAEDAALMRDLRDSFEAGEISLLHQPKRSFADGEIVGVECLARWTHARRGIVSPDWFVAVAEARGEIATLTQWALTRAIADQQALHAGGFDLPFSVNISAALLDDEAFAAWAIDAVKTSGARLCFEITETAAIENMDAAGRTVAAFIAAGIEISIDDFGARLSSLSYLTRIPAHELKIDKKFIAGIDTSDYDRTLVKSMIELAHDLGLKVTAEGVETGAALERLAALGCDFAQGNLISAPLTPSQLQTFLSTT